MSERGKAKLSTPSKLDGTIAGTTKEIIRLYNEVKAAEGRTEEAYRHTFRPSLPAAIELGRLLTNVRASRKGKWLKWLKDSVPFDQKTAWRFMECYRRRDRVEVRQLPNLTVTDVLALPFEPKKKRRSSRAVEEYVRKGIAVDEKAARKMLREQSERVDDAPTVTPEPESFEAGLKTEPEPPPQRRHKSHRQIMKEISSENLERDLEKSQIKIDRDLDHTLDQISRQDHAAWSDFPARLMGHGNDLIREGERLTAPQQQ
jgi:Protein of unknown function (DUF3102)